MPKLSLRRRLQWLCAALILAATCTTAAELRVGLSGEVTSLDPHYLAAQPNLTVARHVFESLTDVDAQTRLIPGLAESWRAIDATTWEFRLRRDVKFHDGSPFTAEDAAFSLARPLSVKGSPGGFAAYVRAVASTTVIDAHTLRVKTKYPYGALPEDLNSILIVSKKHAHNAGPEDFDAGRALVGTGPYKYLRYQRGDRLELARHPQWWGKAPAWDKVTLRIIPADPSRTAALLSGEPDVGDVADVLLQERRDSASARHFFSHVLSRLGGEPRTIVTDRRESYAVARRELLPSAGHHARHPPVRQQPGRVVASANPGPRAGNEAVQVPVSGATVRQGPRRRFQALQPGSPPGGSGSLPGFTPERLCVLGPGGRDLTVARSEDAAAAAS